MELNGPCLEEFKAFYPYCRKCFVKCVIATRGKRNLSNLSERDKNKKVVVPE